MMEVPSKMVKLGAGQKLFSLSNTQRQTLWLVDDEYLLLLSRSGYSERSKRLYLADIQSISHAPTVEGMVTGGLWAAVAASILLFGILCISWVGVVGGLLIASVSLIPTIQLVMGILKGGTCKCLICTAVSTEWVVALKRRVTLEQALTQILPGIDKAQGRLTAEVLQAEGPTAAAQIVASAHAVENLTSEGQSSLSQFSSGRIEDGAQLRHISSGLHQLLFGLAFLFGISHAVDIFVDNNIKNSMDMAVFTFILFLSIILLIRQRKSDMPFRIKALVGVLLCLCVLDFIAQAVFGVVYQLVMFSGDKPPDLMTALPRDWISSQIYCLLGAFAFVVPSVLGILRLSNRDVAAQSSKTGVDRH